MPNKAQFRNGGGFLPRANHDHDSYRWLVLANVMLGTFMAVLDSTIVNVGLTNIMNTFGTSVDKIEWIMTAYMLDNGSDASCVGLDRRPFRLQEELLCRIVLLHARVPALRFRMERNGSYRLPRHPGIGCGAIDAGRHGHNHKDISARKTGMAIGFWGIASAASVSFGPVIGGYLIDNFSWHAIFLVNIPFGILGLAATIIIQKEYRTEKARAFDFGGAISMAVFLTFLLLALACGNSSWNTDGWHSNFIITCFVLAAIGFASFLYIDLRIEHPLIDLRLLKEFNFSMANIVFFIFGFGMFGSTFLLPLYLQNSLGYTALQAGMVFLPIGIIQAVMSPISGVLSDKMNPKILSGAGLGFLAPGAHHAELPFARFG